MRVASKPGAHNASVASRVREAHITATPETNSKTKPPSRVAVISPAVVLAPRTTRTNPRMDPLMPKGLQFPKVAEKRLGIGLRSTSSNSPFVTFVAKKVRLGSTNVWRSPLVIEYVPRRTIASGPVHPASVRVWKKMAAIETIPAAIPSAFKNIPKSRLTR